MQFQLPADRATARRNRIYERLTFLLAAVLVALLTYLAYVGFEGSSQLADHPNSSTDCRTPALMGWPYEAINYDIAADDAVLTEAEPRQCASPPAPAGDEVRTVDGVPLAGWYVPAASGIGPTGPTVVVAHGWGNNKSGMLTHIELLREQYNVVAFDFRNHGQSGGDQTTQGVREADDLRAIVDWLLETKGPEQIAALGSSMGGASVAYAASLDERIDAVIIDSTHATLSSAIIARIDAAGYPLSLPGSWAVLFGGLIRTGFDVTQADAITSVTRLGERPLLVIGAGSDTSMGANDADEIAAAAADAGVNVELRECGPAPHANSIIECPAEFREWVLGFLARALAPAG